LKKPSWRADVEDASARLLEMARRKPELLGADVLYRRSETYSLSLMDGTPEENSGGVSGGISLRCLARDGRQGVATSNGLSPDAVRDVFDWSFANCLASERDEFIMLYEGPAKPDSSELDLYDGGMWEASAPARVMEICSAMTDEARARDPRILSVRSASWSCGEFWEFYASTAGVSLWRRGTSVSCGASVAAGDGERFEMGAYGRAERRAASIDPLEIARAAADRTLLTLGGRPLRTGRYTLLMNPETSASFVDEIGEMFCASDVHKGRSLMAGKLGRTVAGSAVSIADDALMPGKLGSASSDAEGVPSGRTALIESGVASAYMYNLQHAAKDGVKSTGNAARGLAGLPDVGTTNLVMAAGEESPESLTRGVGNGFLATELMGLHTINPVTGDFSLGAKGVRIDGGEMSGPVAGVTIAGNLLDFLKKITAVGNDLEFHGSTAAPTIVVEGVAIAGE
jgi:PmbA protein